MAGRIFAIQDDGTLKAMSEQPYSDEDLFQQLLANYPDLLVGDQIDEASPRRWVLVSREVGVPTEAGEADQFSVDHLFLDQDGVPTLVEVKRSSDHRIRREVVGQMLDYAAHAVAHWRGDVIRARFDAQCEAKNEDATERIASLLQAQPEDEQAIESYWTSVSTNLQAGRIRLMFVADQIGGELRRVIEFLNRFMTPVEVLGVEIRQYQGRGLQALVPRIVGQTMATQGKASAGVIKRQWDAESFFHELEQRRGPDNVQVAKAILEWARSWATRILWGQGRIEGSFTPVLSHLGRDHQVFAIRSYGNLEVHFLAYLRKPPFDVLDKRMEFREKLNAVPGVSIGMESIGGLPKIPLSVFAHEDVLRQLFDAFEWYLDEVRRS